MAIDVFVAAKTLGIECRWRVSNLKMQKILYLAHLDYMGKHNERLVESPFEAWNYGPVQPDLYHKLKRFGARNVRDVFFGEEPLTEGDEFDVLRRMSKLRHVTSGVLIAVTHIGGGGWLRTRNLGMDVIPDNFIREEYHRLVKGANS